jgi:protoporphyrinogen oxidase
LRRDGQGGGPRTGVVLRGTVVLGAGAAGLGSARALRQARRAYEVLEVSSVAGGLCQTDCVDGFSFERTGHVLHLRDRQLQRDFERIVPLRRIERRSAVLVRDRQIPYPFQYNLWALGSAALARSALIELRRAASRRRHAAGSFADDLLETWGATLVSTFFRPYNEKLWGRSLEKLPPDCAGGYLPRVDLELAEEGTRGPVDYRGYNDTFLYPESGRLGDLMDGLAAPIGDSIHLGRGVTAIDPGRRELATADGETIGYDRLISTIPLPRLLELAGVESQRPDLFAATEVMNVRVGIRGRSRTAYHWVYVADPELPFHRIFFPGNLNPRTCPRGCTSLSIEYTIPLGGPRLCAREIATTALEYLSRLDLLDVEECLVVNKHVISPAYVVERAPGRPEFSELARTLVRHGVRLAGRFGAWDYLSIEQAFKSGTRAASRTVAA